MVTCSVCKRDFKTTQGLRGHSFFAHTNNDDLCAEPAAQLAEQYSGFSLAPVSTEHRLSSFEQRLAMLEQATGVLQPDSADRVSSSSRPLLEQMAELAEQLKRTISSSISHAELSPAFEQISKLAGQLNSLDTSHNSMMTALGNLESQLDAKADQEMLRHLQTCLERWGTETDRLLVTMQKAQVENQQQVAGVISSITDRLARVEILARRFPTGEMARVRLKDNREHHFREYGRSDGLTRPYKTKCDLMLGDLWIDLAEPED